MGKEGSGASDGDVRDAIATEDVFHDEIVERVDVKDGRLGHGSQPFSVDTSKHRANAHQVVVLAAAVISVARQDQSRLRGGHWQGAMLPSGHIPAPSTLTTQ